MDQIEPALNAFRDDPLDNGDAVIATDDRRVLELAALADQWDPAVCADLCAFLTDSGVREVTVAIARPEARLLPQDHALWADLRERLAPSGVRLRDPVGLPATA
jgi:hypothetical protein